jgi:hypothetical protein
MVVADTHRKSPPSHASQSLLIGEQRTQTRTRLRPSPDSETLERRAGLQDRCITS